MTERWRRHPSARDRGELLPLGATRDVTRLSSAYVVARLLGHEATLALPLGDNALVRTATGDHLPWATTRRDECEHVRSRGYAEARV